MKKKGKKKEMMMKKEKQVQWMKIEQLLKRVAYFIDTSDEEPKNVHLKRSEYDTNNGQCETKGKKCRMDKNKISSTAEMGQERQGMTWPK